MNNFRLTGIASPTYISKAGTPPNAGDGSADNPYLLLQRYSTNHIIGAGVYEGSFVLSSGNVNTAYYADGLVKIVCTDNISSVTFANTNLTQLNSDTHKEHRFVIDLNDNDYTAGYVQKSYNCVFMNGRYINTLSGANPSELVDCILNCEVDIQTTATYTFNFCSFFSSIVTLSANNKTISNCYFDEASVITLNSYFSSPSTQFINNNFRGVISVAGLSYECKKDSRGELIPERIGNGILDLDVLHGGTGSLYTTEKCFAEEPYFLNLEKKDFWSVSIDSPNLYVGTGNKSIGNVVLANTVKTSDTELSTGTKTLIAELYGDFVTTASSGTVISKAIEIAPFSTVITANNITAALNFNSTATPGGLSNRNVTISDNYTTGAGTNPRRLTYEMQWTTADSIPTTDNDWTNGGLTARNTWVKFEQNTQPMFNGGKGSGEPDFSPVGAVMIRARYVRFRIKLFNGIG